MKLNHAKIKDIVKEYVALHVLPKAPNDFTKFGIGFMVPYIGNAVDKMDAQYMPMAKTLGIADASGLIDMELAHQAAASALAQAGGKITAFGLVMDRSDIDAIYEISKRFAA